MYTVYSNKKDWEQREREVDMDMLPAAAVVPLGGRAWAPPDAAWIQVSLKQNIQQNYNAMNSK